MKHRTFLRWIAALLILALLPVPVSAAGEELLAVSVPYCRLFSDYTGMTELWIDADGSYYMTLEAAAAMLNLRQDSDGSFVTQNGYVRLNPDPYDLTVKSVDIFSLFPLAGLMDQFQACVFVNRQGVLCVNTAADNLDRMLAETDRILSNGAYSADLLGNLSGGEEAQNALTLFAALYDAVWNLRIDALWGKAQDDDYQDFLLKILRPAGSPDNLLEVMAKRAKTLDQAITVTLGVNDGYEAFCEALGESIPGEGRLLLGEAGTAPFRQILEGIKDVDEGETLSLRDYLKIGAHLFEVEQISDFYADALGALLDQVDTSKDKNWLAFAPGALCRNGKSVLRSYASYQDDERSYLLKDGVSLVVQECLNTYVGDAIKDEWVIQDPASKVLQTAINLFDAHTLQVNKKNSAVLTLVAAAELQKDFAKMYALAKDSDEPLATRAALLRGAMVLYLRTAWESYEAVRFDETLAGAVSRVQTQVEQELDTLYGFTDALFFYQKNADIAPGSFGENDPVVPTESVNPYESQYRTLLRHYEWLIDAGLELSNVEDFSARDLGSYCFYDMDRDGIDELLVLAQLSYADAAFLVYKGGDSGVTLLGRAATSGGSTLFGYDGKGGVALSSAHQGMVLNTVYTLTDGRLTEQGTESFYLNDDDPYPVPEGAQRLTMESIREVANAASTWTSTFGDAFEIAPLNGRFAFTAPGEWGGYYQVEDGEMASTLYFLAPGGERYPLFTLGLTGYTDEGMIDLPHYRVIGQWGGGFLALATWDCDYRAILAQKDRQVRDQYWTMVESMSVILPYIEIR